MKIILALISLILSLIFVSCTPQEDLLPENEIPQNSDVSAISDESAEENENLSAVLKDLEYKSAQAVINLFGGIEINQLGEYNFDYFTDNGAKAYDELKLYAKDKSLVNIGKAVSNPIEGKSEISVTVGFTAKDNEPEFIDFTYVKTQDGRKIDSMKIIAEQTHEEFAFDENDESVIVKICEYKALQTIVDIFNQTEISSGFTERGLTLYNEYRDVLSGKELTSAGVAGGTKNVLDEGKNRLVIITWFSYKNTDVRTCFEIIFVNENGEWLIDSVGMDS